MQSFDAYYAQALEAEKGLEPLDQNQAENQHLLCHGDLDQHHILPGKQEAGVYRVQPDAFWAIR